MKVASSRKSTVLKDLTNSLINKMRASTGIPGASSTVNPQSNLVSPKKSHRKKSISNNEPIKPSKGHNSTNI
jgi:hypothetical protein